MEGLALLLFAAALYFLPSIIANRRHVALEGTVIIIDIFLGWTVIGWVVALAMAFGPTRAPLSTDAQGPGNWNLQIKKTDVHKWDPPKRLDPSREGASTSLTPEERQRIYEEEKVRLEVREQLRQEQAAKDQQQ